MIWFLDPSSACQDLLHNYLGEHEHRGFACSDALLECLMREPSQAPDIILLAIDVFSASERLALVNTLQGAIEPAAEIAWLTPAPPCTALSRSTRIEGARLGVVAAHQMPWDESPELAYWIQARRARRQPTGQNPVQPVAQTSATVTPFRRRQ